MENISLSEFITNALTEIAEGIRNANSKLKNPEKHQYEVFSLRHNKGDNSKIPGVKFDVAVNAANKQTDKAGFVVALASIAGGANTQKEKGHEQVHRIQFEIGIENDWK